MSSFLGIEYFSLMSEKSLTQSRMYFLSDTRIRMENIEWNVELQKVDNEIHVIHVGARRVRTRIIDNVWYFNDTVRFRIVATKYLIRDKTQTTSKKMTIKSNVVIDIPAHIDNIKKGDIVYVGQAAQIIESVVKRPSGHDSLFMSNGYELKMMKEDGNHYTEMVFDFDRKCHSRFVWQAISEIRK